MHIKEIYIKGLFGEHDVRWSLDKDVNILSALNGEGKTTILSIVASILLGEEINKKYVGLVESVVITFDGEEKLEFYFKKRKKEEEFSQFDNIKNVLAVHKYYDGENSTNGGYWGYTIYNRKDEIRIPINYLSTFDQNMINGDDIRKGANDNRIKTELDLNLHFAQSEFLEFSYRKISSLMEQAKKGEVVFEEISSYLVSIYHILNNEAFKDKKITIGHTEHDDSDFVAIRKEEKELSMYNLSSGEKQLLLLLLTVVMQNEKECILILDEPEISLHYNWQEKLVGWIRRLNPNVQIILATHSPFILIDGLSDKTQNLSDLIER